MVEFAAGLVLTATTISNVFSSILVPGPSESPLRFASRVRKLTLPVWHWMSRIRQGGRQRLSNSFAPLLFSLAFIGWIVLLLIGFALRCCTQPLHYSPRRCATSDKPLMSPAPISAPSGQMKFSRTASCAGYC